MAKKRRFIDTVQGKLIIACLVGVLSAGSYFGGKAILLPKFHDWRQAKILEQANEALKSEQYADSLLLVRKGIQRYKENEAFWELGIKVAEEMDSPEALRFAILLEERNPSLENKFKVIEVAIKYRSPFRAVEQLNNLPPEASRNKRTHELALEVYGLLNDQTKIKSHLRSLLSLDPSDTKRALRLELMNLADRSTHLTEQETAKILSLAEQSGESEDAILALFQFAVQRGDKDSAMRFLESDLPKKPEVQTLRLAAMKIFGLPGYTQELDLFLGNASTEENSPSRIIQTLTQIQEFNKARAFYDSLDEEEKDSSATQSAISVLYLSSETPADAIEVLVGADWGRLEHERLSLLSFAYDKLGKIAARNDAWTQAIGEAGSRFESLNALRRMANIRRWQEQLIQTYRAILVAFPGNQEAYRSLVAHDQSTRNADGLLRTFSRRLEANPNDLDSKNNVAYLNLLAGTEPKRSLQQSKETHEAQPENSHYAYTYALALILNEQPGKALEVIDQYEEELMLHDARRITKSLAQAHLEQFAEAESSIKFIDTPTLLPGESDLLRRVKGMVVKANLHLQNQAKYAKLRSRLTDAQKALQLLPNQAQTSDLQNYDNALLLHQVGRYAELEILLNDTSWGQQDYLKFAAISFSQSNRGENRLSNSNWESAVAEARNNPEYLNLLQDFAKLHGLVDRESEIAATRFARDPRDDTLFELLEQRAIAAKDELLLREIYERKTTALSPDTRDVPSKLAYYYLVTQQNSLKAMELINNSPEEQNLANKKAQMLMLLKNGSPQEAFSMWEALSSLERQSSSTKLIEALIRYRNSESSKARILFSEIDHQDLLFFETEFHKNVRDEISQPDQ